MCAILIREVSDLWHFKDYIWSVGLYIIESWIFI